MKITICDDDQKEMDAVKELLDEYASRNGKELSISCLNEPEEFLLVRSWRVVARVRLSSLEYCEIYNKTIYYHLTDGEIVKAPGSMASLEAQLSPYPQFFKPHRSYMVNFKFVMSVSNGGIIMNSGATVPIPHGKLRDTRSKFLDYFNSP